MLKRILISSALFMVGCGDDAPTGAVDASVDAAESIDASADSAADAARDLGLADAGVDANIDAAVDAEVAIDMTIDAPDPCLSHACENESTCVPDGATYTCDCTAGYEGERCESSIDDCAANPCEHDGVCTDGHLSFSCDCVGGYFGATCSYAAPVLSVSWDDGPRLASMDVAGYAPVSNWNMALGRGLGEGDGGSKAGLLDRAGTATDVGVSWSGQDIEVTTHTAGTTGDRGMMSMGLRSWLTMGDASVTFSGLDAEFPNGVRFVVYVGRGGGFPTDHSASFSLSIGDDTMTGRVMPSFDGTWNLLAGDGDQGNWYVSPIQTDDEVTITLAATGGATLATAAINGIALVPVEAP